MNHKSRTRLETRMGPGTIGNETVNYFAKKSLEYSDQHICNDIPYGINKIISIAKKHYTNEWQNRWDNLKHTWHYNIKPLVHTVRPKSKSIFIDKQITKIRLGMSYKLAILGHRYLASPDKEHEIRKLHTQSGIATNWRKWPGQKN